ncbi:NB-ARC domains-containing protein [Artemisia annua]|uniref:NB-ARC domains-containing protein n=1 Tax=Artemisia annua TaxID=35608 RepID=A0A2U1NPX7_ARTAN|nr:NB-ARC domains-containing protein [Artemisia annua]
MADAMASTLIKAVLQKLADEAMKQVVRVKGIRSELKDLEKTLPGIQHLAYDIADILDDLATDGMHPDTDILLLDQMCLGNYTAT